MLCGSGQPAQPSSLLSLLQWNPTFTGVHRNTEIHVCTSKPSRTFHMLHSTSKVKITKRESISIKLGEPYPVYFNCSSNVSLTSSFLVFHSADDPAEIVDRIRTFQRLFRFRTLPIQLQIRNSRQFPRRLLLIGHPSSLVLLVLCLRQSIRDSPIVRWRRRCRRYLQFRKRYR